MSKILSFALPIAASLIPGIGPAIGGSILGAGAAGSATLGSALLGAGIGGLTGGGLKGALLGGAGGALGANIGSLGSGMQGPGLASAGGAPIGGGSGILGAIGDNIPGVQNLGNSFNISDILGKASSAPLGEGVQGPSSPGSGLLGNLGAVGRGIEGTISSSGNLLGGTGGGSTFNGGSMLSSALGGYQEDEALKKAQEQLLAGNNMQLQNLESFDPSGLGQDPGYEFRKAEGEKALNRSLGATGNIFSGRALTDASKFNQGLADEEFDDYYSRWLTKTGAQNQIYGNSADTRAATTIGRSNSLSKALSGILSPQKKYSLEDIIKIS